ncbi:hypothetical protein Rhopal_001261-T1 [Rhodotorula paludigena]|uniref:Uncharacterized protein n=1 Tax=Rhodotorula paludigena TaxID=86838 RepID=A0AAV5G6V6_9BASI|nr:hypothetical protein Rhopal_001261-T1 [Rhodotorula paludigena]
MSLDKGKAPATPTCAPGVAGHKTFSSQQAMPAKTLRDFLLALDGDSFAPFLDDFDRNYVPLSTPAQSLIDVAGSPNGVSTLFEVFEAVQTLPPFLTALAVAGLRKAYERQQQAPAFAEPGSAVVNGRLIFGMPYLKRDQWVRQQIAGELDSGANPGQA